MRFVNSQDAARLAELGTSCPDHFLRTKIKPLYVDWNPQTETTASLKAKLIASPILIPVPYSSLNNVGIKNIPVLGFLLVVLLCL